MPSSQPNLSVADDRLALDRATARTYDSFGRLYVGVTNISKATVNPYRGNEIPDCEALGLDPNKIYQLFRDPEELARAAATFNNLPLLSRHVPVTAENHQPDLVIGSTGTDAEFAAPYLRNSLVVWAKDAIEGIESEAQKELSSAYRYRADMTPGTFQGQPYDGVMRDIVGNHVALVRAGRAGSDVVVGDSAIPPKLNGDFDMTTAVLSRKAVMAQGAVLAFLMPKLAQDAKIDITTLFSGVSAKNFKDKKASILEGLKSSTKDKLAKDASIDDVAQLLDVLEKQDVAEGADTDPTTGLPVVGGAKKPAEDDADGKTKLLEMLKGMLNPEQLAQVTAVIGGQAADAETAEEKQAREDAAKAKDEEMKNMVTKPAMDAAISSAVKSATDQAVKTQREIREAERAVRPYVGELAMAHDSAEAVYRTALTTLGAKIDGVHASAFPAILAMQPLPGSVKKTASPDLAQDAASQKDFNDRIPGAARIGIL